MTFMMPPRWGCEAAPEFEMVNRSTATMINVKPNVCLMNMFIFFIVNPLPLFQVSTHDPWLTILQQSLADSSTEQGHVADEEELFWNESNIHNRK
jgi:hypothetical protein